MQCSGQRRRPNNCYIRVHMVITACAVLHNICLGAGDIVAPEDEPVPIVVEDEGENDVEAVAGAQWRDHLSAEVSALEEAPRDHDYV
ncbi:hypothetical protein NL108_012032 [Boleophthalmus pectinirostris]|nr:hypothetical protein NL108_012032 [Boleophthalmus pectinirostris]